MSWTPDNNRSHSTSITPHLKACFCFAHILKLSGKKQMFSSFNNCRDEDAEKKKTGQKSASLQKHCWDTHTSLVLLSLTTSCSQNYTQTKWWPAEKKESTATIWWSDCEGCAVVRFYVAVSDKQEHPQQRTLVKWTFWPVVFVLSHLFTGCDQRSHPLTRFIFLEVKVTVHQSPQYHKCLSTGHCDTSHHYWASQQFVSSDKHHSHPLCGFRKHNLGKNMRKHAELWLSVWDKLQLKTWLIFIGIRDKVFVSCTRGFWLI